MTTFDLKGFMEEKTGKRTNFSLYKIKLDNGSNFDQVVGDYKISGNFKGSDALIVIIINKKSYSFTGSFTGSLLKGLWKCKPLNTEGIFEYEIKGYPISMTQPSEENKVQALPPTNAPVSLGNWTGFFMQKGVKYPMALEIELTLDGKFLGTGSDQVGAFEVNGTLVSGNALISKQYIGKHLVTYKGVLQDMCITGKWCLSNGVSDDFKLYLPGKNPEIIVPKGNWTGFFMEKGKKYDMVLNMELGSNGKFKGDGSDAVGGFSIQGVLANGMAELMKQYIGKHKVIYKGLFNGKIINGKWSLDNGVCDIFQLNMP